MLKLQKITRKMGDFFLDEMEFCLPSGYIMAIAGENGAGKTTLLKILLGLLKPTSGEIYYENERIDYKMNKMKEDMGFVLSDDIFNDTLSLLNNANMYGKYYKNYQQSVFQTYADEFGLNITQLYGKVSKGEQMKFQLAFALSHAPKLLILDEPTANFDPEFRKKFIKIMTSFVSDGTKSVIMATHDLSAMEHILDYLFILKKGRLLLFEDVMHIRDRYKFVSGNPITIHFIRKDKVIHIEENRYTCKALLNYNKDSYLDSELQVEEPSLEEFVYFYLKGVRHGKTNFK